MTTMQNTPSEPTSSKRSRGKELTAYQRGIIIGLASGGFSVAEISQQQKIPISTIRDTISKASSRDEGKSAKRSGRPKLASEADVRLILRIVRKDPSITYKQLRSDSGLAFSDDTFYRILKAARITNSTANQQAKSNEAHTKETRVKKRPVLRE